MLIERWIFTNCVDLLSDLEGFPGLRHMRSQPVVSRPLGDASRLSWGGKDALRAGASVRGSPSLSVPGCVRAHRTDPSSPTHPSWFSPNPPPPSCVKSLLGHLQSAHLKPRVSLTLLCPSPPIQICPVLLTLTLNAVNIHPSTQPLPMPRPKWRPPRPDLLVAGLPALNGHLSRPSPRLGMSLPQHQLRPRSDLAEQRCPGLHPPAYTFLLQPVALLCWCGACSLELSFSLFLRQLVPLNTSAHQATGLSPGPEHLQNL